ncbi:hypothetical protein [Streptomyces sp. N35]|uniref:hypothetical protein n=1 Tax=Streptomyces sp. N35 TaxID=2795730 RepID=UPI0018F5122C|nr:hypothetical protein [Streptomyces sp. N35]
MHSVVLVCLPSDTRPEDIEAAVADALLPYSMEAVVDPWLDYQTGPPHEHWSVHDRGLPAGTTWAQVARLRNEAYPGQSPMLVDDDGHAYVVATYNPHGEWDWYQIGGRWSGYFPCRPQADGDPRLVAGSRSWTNEDQAAEPLTCDGGPLRLLDLDAMRRRKGDEAAALYDLWESAVRGLPAAQPLSHFLERHQADPDAYSRDEACDDYRAQPAVAAVAGVPALPMMDPVGYFAAGREACVREARAGAVAGAVLLTLEGAWIERPWGLETPEPAETAYVERVTAYLEGLDPDAYVICVDCHS